MKGAASPWKSVRLKISPATMESRMPPIYSTDITKT